LSELAQTMPVFQVMKVARRDSRFKTESLKTPEDQIADN
jgi:hypothetical protein